MEEDKRHFKGVWTPKVLYDDPQLDATDRELLAEINALDDGVKGCFASNEHFAKRQRLQVGTIVNRITRLRRLGYISTLKFDGRVRWICVPQLRDQSQASINEWRQTPLTNGGSLHKRMEDKGKAESKAKSKRVFEPSTDFLDERLQEEWSAFQTHRNQMGKPMTPLARRRMIDKLNTFADIPARIAALSQSIANGWQGVFEVRQERGAAKPKLRIDKRNEIINKLNRRKVELLRKPQTKEVQRELEHVQTQLNKL
jgi:hypothetical protein